MAATKTIRKSVKTTRKSRAAMPRRAYNSPLRQQQAVDTRHRILAVGAEIARELPNWDWDAMTFKAVGERANMSERTVRRHFTTERMLRNAIQQRLIQECGVDFPSVEIPAFAAAAEQVLRYLSGFASTSQPTSDPGFTAIDADRRTSLLQAVTRAAPSWSPVDRAIMAATLDMFWNPVNFGRFSSAWQLDQGSVIKLIHWVVGLLEGAMRDGKRP